MDLLQFWRVIQRHRTIVVVGLLLTFAAMAFMLFRVPSWPPEYRSPAVYGAKSTLFVTQSGFPWGRSALAEYVRGRGAGEGELAVPRFADPSRMEYLASLYSNLALSDDVQGRVERNGYTRDEDIGERYTAQPLATPGGGALPLIEIVGESTSERRAVEIANTAARALRLYVAQQQTLNQVPENTRIVLPVVTRAAEGDAKVIKGVKITTALMIGMLGLISTLFVAFLVENVQRQRRFADSMDDMTSSAPSESVLSRLPARDEVATMPSAIAPHGRD